MARKQTLTQRIALDGGKDIKKELEALGEEGKAAFAALKRAADDTAKSGTALNKFLRDLNRDLKAIKTGAKSVALGLNEIAGGVGQVAVRGTALAAAVTAAGTGLFLLTKNGAAAADALRDTAQTVGLNVEEFQRLKFAFEQNGSNVEGLSTSFRKFNQVIAQAATGTGAGVELFKQLGVSVVDAAGNLKSGEVIFQEVATAIAKLPEGALKADLAMKLFGKSGAAITQVLNEGGASIRAYGDEAVRLGFVLSEELVQAGADFNDALEKLQATLGGVKNEFGLLIAPAFTAAFTELTEIIADNRDTIVQLGESIRDFLIPLVADFFALLRGDDAAVANQALLQVRDTVVNLANAFNFVYTAVSTVFKILTDAVQPILDIFNAIFGTNIRADVAFFVALLANFLGVFRLIGAVVKGVQLIFLGLVSIFGTVTAQIAAVSAGALVLVSVLKQLVDWAIDGVKWLFEPFEGLVKAVVDATLAVLAFFGFLVEAAPGAVENVDGVKAAIAETKKTVEGLGGATEEAVANVNTFKPAAESATKSFTEMGDAGESAYARIGKGVQQLQNNMAGLALALTFSTEKATELYQALQAVGGSSGSFQTLSGGGADSIQKLAVGGAVRGAGTGTSDSILARLSNGEFVMRAAAVRRYGLRFLNALNSGKALKGFSMGGLVANMRVPDHLPAFAEGGLVQQQPQGRPFNLNIGGEIFNDLLAPAEVADRLVKFATGQKVRRAGNKPSWYGGR